MRVLSLLLVCALASSVSAVDDWKAGVEQHDNHILLGTVQGVSSNPDADPWYCIAPDEIDSGDDPMSTYDHWASLDIAGNNVQSNAASKHSVSSYLTVSGQCSGRNGGSGKADGDSTGDIEWGWQAKVSGSATGRIYPVASKTNAEFEDGAVLLMQVFKNSTGIASLQFTYDKSRDQWWKEKVYGGRTTGWTAVGGQLSSTDGFDWGTSVSHTAGGSGDIIYIRTYANGYIQYEDADAKTDYDGDYEAVAYINEDIN